jgi:hypothetical protein
VEVTDTPNAGGGFAQVLGPGRGPVFYAEDVSNWIIARKSGRSSEICSIRFDV